MDTKRFNRPDYKRKIQANRNHKRQIQTNKKTPEIRSIFKDFTFFTWVQTAFWVFFVGVIIYLSYFAHFIQISNLQISGADTNEVPAIQTAFASFIEQNAFDILPQKNILFFKKSAFANYLLKQDSKILAVDSVQKKLWNTIDVQIAQRVPAFYITANGDFYIIDNEGVVSSQTLSYDTTSNLRLIEDHATENFGLGNQVFTKQSADFLVYVDSQFNPMIAPEQTDHYEINGVSTNNLTLVTKDGMFFYFDLSSDPKMVMQHLFSLWASLTPAQQKDVVYIDMRFDQNAYVCYKGAPCASTPAPTTIVPVLPNQPNGTIPVGNGSPSPLGNTNAITP